MDLSLFAPRTLLAFDPDSTRTAYCVARKVEGHALYEVIELAGGGTGEPVVWGSVRGALALISDLGGSGAGLRVGVEAQLASGGAFSADVEGCRRVRWHVDAACELAGVEITHVDPGAWMASFVPGVQGIGATKLAYRARARTINAAAINEDRAAAVGIAWWLAVRFGCELAQP